MTQTIDEEQAANGASPRSLAVSAARNLATTTKTVPQIHGTSPRWLLRMLPWVEAGGGAYRVNRRLTYTSGTGMVSFHGTGSDVGVIPPSLTEIAPLNGLSDAALLAALAERFRSAEHQAGEVITAQGEAADRLVLVAYGKVTKTSTGKYGHQAEVGTASEGNHLGVHVLADGSAIWPFTATAATACITLTLHQADIDEVTVQYPALADHLASYLERARLARNHKGESDIALASGHGGEAYLPGTFADYELRPREYELHVAQTMLQVHTRVADLFSDPMNQVEEQLRLTVDALRERQEHEMLNNPDRGLLHSVDLSQRLHTSTGPPTPDDMDALLARRRKTRFYLAHPLAIAAFGRQCSSRGIYPTPVEVEGRPMQAWRGVPILPCNKIPITAGNTTSILAMRTGEKDQGVIGLHRTGIADEYQPGLSVRFMHIDEQAIISYLVSAYYTAAVLVPDALGILENVELGH